MPQVTLDSPLGPLLIEEEADILLRLHIGPAVCGDAAGHTPLLREAMRQLTAYFSGGLRHFDLPLAACGTSRGEALRSALADIAYGETRSYGAVARRIGSSPRAIGQACRRNPFPIIIPCHRVVAASGQIGHYSAGEGVATKLWLLARERGGTEWER